MTTNGHVAGFFIHALRLLAKHASGQYITGNSVDTSLGAKLSFIPQYRSRGSCNGAAAVEFAAPGGVLISVSDRYHDWHACNSAPDRSIGFQSFCM